jgi:putative membrane protein
MSDPAAPHAPASTLPPASVNGSRPGNRPAEPVQPVQPAQPAPCHRGRGTRISGVRTALIVGFVLLVLVLIFIIQNAHSVSISYMGAHVHLSLAVALLLAAVAGALVMAAAGTARITELRSVMRRDRRGRRPGNGS